MANRTISISLDTKTIKELKQLAKKSNKSVSQWITEKVWGSATLRKTAIKKPMEMVRQGKMNYYDAMKEITLAELIDRDTCPEMLDLASKGADECIVCLKEMGIYDV